jgi:hypothetical protein
MILWLKNKNWNMTEILIKIDRANITETNNHNKSVKIYTCDKTKWRTSLIESIVPEKLKSCHISMSSLRVISWNMSYVPCNMNGTSTNRKFAQNHSNLTKIYLQPVQNHKIKLLIRCLCLKPNWYPSTILKMAGCHK